MDTITYRGCEYPLRVVDVPGHTDGARISITDLNDELMNCDGNYVDEEGRRSMSPSSFTSKNGKSTCRRKNWPGLSCTT
jgi:hypothetical protein